MSNMPQAKALEAAMNDINNSFGKGAVTRLGNAGGSLVDSFPSGCLTLDIALGVGLPRGNIVEGDLVWAISSDTIHSLVGLSELFFVLPLMNSVNNEEDAPEKQNFVLLLPQWNDENVVLHGEGMEASRGRDVNLMAPVISSDVNLGNTNTELSLAILPPQAPGGTIPRKRRRPCYGWIDDEDDVDDIVHLRTSPGGLKTVNNEEDAPEKQNNDLPDWVGKGKQ
ncbi:hypothetical protein ACET3Z_000259 [Daucus carota]